MEQKQKKLYNLQRNTLKLNVLAPFEVFIKYHY